MVNERYRHQKLLQLLDEKQLLSTQDIMRFLSVSPATVRRDITKLHQQGLLKKIRNGAESVSSESQSHSHKKIKNSNEKKRIAYAASQLCRDGDSILLTCGSTMLMLGEHLQSRHLQVITNYLPLANKLIEKKHDDVVIIGGQYNKDKHIMLPLYAENKISYAVNIMFTSGKGFTEDGLYKTDIIIANSEKQMSAQASKYVVLLDSSKLGQKVGMLFTELNDIDLLITGKEADAIVVEQLRAKGLDVILA